MNEFTHQGTFGQFWSQFLAGERAATNMVSRGMNAAKHHIMHRKSPTAKNYPAHNVRDAKVENSGLDLK